MTTKLKANANLGFARLSGKFSNDYIMTSTATICK